MLVVDDQRHDADRTGAALRTSLGASIVVHQVQTLAEGLGHLSQHRTDVIVLELNARDLSGSDTLRQLRSSAPFVPIVVFTKYPTDALALRLLRDGAQDCLSKQQTTADQLGRVLLYAMERQRRITQLETARIEAAHRATHDPLTGLANRDLFLDQFDRALALGSRHTRNTGLLFVDLDGFKSINDTYGHNCGDAVLRSVASRLIDSVRRSDSVARLGGDEFVVLLRDITARADIVQVCETVLLAIRKPIFWGSGRRLSVDASIGGAIAPLDGATATVLLDAADADMYREKMQRRRERMATPALAARSLIAAIGDLQLPKPVAPSLATSSRATPSLAASSVVQPATLGSVAIGTR